MRKAKEMNYEGSLLDLFKEAEAGGFANDINKPKKSTYVDARSGYGFPTTYEHGGVHIDSSFGDKGRAARAMRPAVGEFVEGQPEGSKSTHLMTTVEADGIHYAYPSITNKNAPYAGYQEQSFEQALANGEAIPFRTFEEADKFAKGAYKLPEIKREGGYKKEGEIIPNDEVAGTTETISLRHGLDNMPNSLELFLSKKHVLSSSDLEIKASVKEMAEGGISDIVTDYDSVWEYAKQGDDFLTRRKGSNNWITAKGDSATSIARGVYNLDKDNETIPATPYVNPTPVLKDMEKSEDPVKKQQAITIRSSTRELQNMLLGKGYELPKFGADGYWGSETSKAYKKYIQDEGINNLPVFTGEANQKCTAQGCSEVATNNLLSMFPDVRKSDLAPEDAWYRRAALLEQGSTQIWGLGTEYTRESEGGNIGKMPFPPASLWKDLKVGDVITFNRRGAQFEDRESKRGVGRNMGSEHIGIIVGSDAETGKPLIMHGGGGTMQTAPIDAFTGKHSGAYAHDRYKIDGIVRPKALEGRNVNYGAGIFFGGDYNDFQVKSVQGDNSVMRSYITNANNNIKKLAQATDSTPTDVREAIAIGYGIIKNETGDVKGVAAGEANTYIKEIGSKIIDFAESDAYKYAYMVSPVLAFTAKKGLESEKGQEIKRKLTTEASKGQARIKFNMQQEDAEGNLTQFGKAMSVLGIESGNDLRLNMDNTSKALIAKILVEKKRMTSSDDFNAEQNTYKGIDLNYILANLHKYGTFNSANRKKYLENYDRDYGNAVIDNAKNILSKDGEQLTSLEKTATLVNDAIAQRQTGVRTEGMIAENLNRLPIGPKF